MFQVARGEKSLPVVSNLLTRLGVTPDKFVADLATLHEAIKPRLSFKSSDRGTTRYRITAADGKPAVLYNGSHQEVYYDPSEKRLVSHLIAKVVNAPVQLTPVNTYAIRNPASRKYMQFVPLPEGHVPWSFHLLEGSLSDDDRHYLTAITSVYGRMDENAHSALYNIMDTSTNSL